jgi:hypothetical protein
VTKKNFLSRESFVSNRACSICDTDEWLHKVLEVVRPRVSRRSSSGAQGIDATAQSAMPHPITSRYFSFQECLVEVPSHHALKSMNARARLAALGVNFVVEICYSPERLHAVFKCLGGTRYT